MQMEINQENILMEINCSNCMWCDKCDNIFEFCTDFEEILNDDELDLIKEREYKEYLDYMYSSYSDLLEEFNS